MTWLMWVSRGTLYHLFIQGSRCVLLSVCCFKFALASSNWPRGIGEQGRTDSPQLTVLQLWILPLYSGVKAVCIR